MIDLSKRFPDDENGNVLRRMHENGDDLAKARDIDFTVALPDKAAAQRVGDHFHKLGYRVSANRSQSATGLPWDVVVIKFMLPTHAGIGQFEEELQRVAATHGGRNDGWGCYQQ
jgi:hypothetical protein